jgi:hypothetical protein
VKLTDELDARLRHEAERRETTVSELTRGAIEAHVDIPRMPPTTPTTLITRHVSNFFRSTQAP